MWSRRESSMRHITGAIIVAVPLAVLVASCGGSKSPAAPTPAPIPACQANNTAKVYFLNRSVSNTTYTIVWDGANLVTVGPGQDSQTFDVAAGVTHTLRFNITNTNIQACNPAQPVLTQCATQWYSCNY
jgi:hypothetical protein